MAPVFMLVLLASAVPGTHSEPESAALAALSGMGVTGMEVRGVRRIEAPLGGILVDVTGTESGVFSAYRVGIEDGTGEVFTLISFGEDLSWRPSADASPEDRLALEFLLEDRENFMSLVLLPPGTVTAGGAEVSWTAMLDSLSTAGAVLVGEAHDDPLAHRWELFIWACLASPDRSLALEMFETDVQGLLDDYLAGNATLEEFLGGSRPWGNYLQDYSPMVEYARKQGFRVVAANVPRPLAAAVAREGWAALAGEPFFGELRVDSSNALYRDRFLATMETVAGGMHQMPVDPVNLYRAQLLKDAVMASSVAGNRCMMVCGSFHSDYRSGIPDQFPPGVSFLTVKILPEGEPLDPGAADFVVVR
jgi:uncharacterized iron-regulated protein